MHTIIRFFLPMVALMYGVESRPYLYAKDLKSPYVGDYHPRASNDQTFINLLVLFNTLGVKIEESYEAMNVYAHQHWRRNPFKKGRVKNSIHQSKIKEILPILETLGMINSITPYNDTPDYAIILGGNVQHMRIRMQYMLNLICSVTFSPKQIIMITADRPLESSEQKALVLDKAYLHKGWTLTSALPRTETEAAMCIWDQLPKPERIKKIPVSFVSTPMLEKKGKTVSPH